MSKKRALKKAIKLAGGQSALGRLIGRNQDTISWWLHKSKQGVPADMAPIIEVVLEGQVTKEDLRPDVFK